MIFLPNGYLYSVNKEFKKIFQKNESEFDESKFVQLFEPMNKNLRVTDMSKLTSDKYYFNIFGKKIEVDLNFNIKTIVVNKERF